MLAPVTGLTGGAPALQLLAQVVAVAPDEPSMRDMPQQELRLQNEMVVADVSVTQLLTDPRVGAVVGGGSTTGDLGAWPNPWHGLL